MTSISYVYQAVVLENFDCYCLALNLLFVCSQKFISIILQYNIFNVSYKTPPPGKPCFRFSPSRILFLRKKTYFTDKRILNYYKCLENFLYSYSNTFTLSEKSFMILLCKIANIYGRNKRGGCKKLGPQYIQCFSNSVFK